MAASGSQVQAYYDAYTCFYLGAAIFGVLINTGHLIVVSQLPVSRSENTKIFFYALGETDLITAMIRLITTNELATRLLSRHPSLCALSALTSNAAQCTGFAIILLGIIDRLLMITSTNYFNRLYVKHYTAVIFGTFVVIAMSFAALGAAFYNTAFSVKALGPCEFAPSRLRFLRPTLTFGFSISVPYVIVSAIVMHKLRKNFSIMSTGTRQAQTILHRFFLILVLVKCLTCWLPVIIHWILGAVGVKSVISAQVSRVIYCLSPSINPIVFGGFNRRYRKVLQQICRKGCRQIQNASVSPAHNQSNTQDGTNTVQEINSMDNQICDSTQPFHSTDEIC